jgi:secondary thiamine-phosphate synthase enzyme
VLRAASAATCFPASRCLTDFGQTRYLRAMEQVMFVLEVQAERRGLLDITTEVGQWVSRQSISSGMLTLFCRHTSASLLIQENAAPAVRRDMEKFFDQLAPETPGRYEHDDEGPDDMPAHLKTALTQVQLAVPVMDSKLMLGIWQGIYLFEHRSRPSMREIILHLAGE